VGDSGKGEILAMTRDEVIAAFNAIRVWTNGDRRAVHKPLLVLLALSRVNDVTAQTMDWNDAEPLLKSLLEEFGPDGSSNTRHYPFWHLQTDGIWQLDGPQEILNRPAGATPTLTELRQNHVRGGFTMPIYNALKADPDLINVVAQRIVDAHFPESIRGDVLDAVGLAQSESMGTRLRTRNADVIRRFGPRCCWHTSTAARCAATTCAWGNSPSDWRPRTSSGSKPMARTKCPTALPCARCTTRCLIWAHSRSCRRPTRWYSASISTVARRRPTGCWRTTGPE
jgi:hypothetical protein